MTTMSARAITALLYSRNSLNITEMTYYVYDIIEQLFQHPLGIDANKRILLIHGPMGSGKSTMALRLVERLARNDQSPLCLVAGRKSRTAICTRSGGRISAYPSSAMLNDPLVSCCWGGPLII